MSTWAIEIKNLSPKEQWKLNYISYFNSVNNFFRVYDLLNENSYTRSEINICSGFLMNHKELKMKQHNFQNTYS